MTTFRSIEFLNLLLKHKENAARRVAVLKLGREWVRKEILFCASFVRFQGIIKNYVKVVGLVGGRCGYVSVGHNGENEELVHVERRQDSGVVGMGDTTSRIRKYLSPRALNNC